MRHQVRVDEIPAGGFLYHVDEQVPAIQEQLRDVLEIDGAHRCRAELQVTRQEHMVQIDGRVSMSLQLPCARCLEPFSFVEQRTIHVVLLLDPPVDDGKQEQELEQELVREDLDESYLEGDEIDLPELLREQVLLSLPAKPLCSEACKGLCPRCGVDLNRETCTCETTPVDPRMAVLQGLKIEDDN